MYSVRLTSPHHGKATTFLLLFILGITFSLQSILGGSFWIIYFSSVCWHLWIEIGLFVSGMRKGKVFAGVHQLPKSIEILQRAMVEGPAFCVPAYLISSAVRSPNFSLILLGFVLVIMGSLFSAISDYRSIKSIPKEDRVFTRRAMNNPVGMMVLGICNAMVLFYIALHSETWAYILAYAASVLIFYIIHFPLGLRFIQLKDEQTNAYYQPGKGMQGLGLIYDSVYEMTLFIAPAYLIPWSFGWLS